MTINDRTKLKNLIADIDNLDRDLDKFLKDKPFTETDYYLAKWVAYNDKRLNLLIRMVKILMKGEK